MVSADGLLSVSHPAVVVHRWIVGGVMSNVYLIWGVHLCYFRVDVAPVRQC